MSDALYRERMHKLYKSARWRKMRAEQLRAHPYCQCPIHRGKRIPASVVDHKKPHRGDDRLFWSRANLQSMTKACHDGMKQQFERSGVMSGCDASGFPIDPSHLWSRA